MLYSYFLLSYFIGLPVPAVPAGLPIRIRKPPSKKRKALSVNQESEDSSESSDDSDEDWVPGSEEVRKRNKMTRRFIPGSFKKDSVQVLNLQSIQELFFFLFLAS